MRPTPIHTHKPCVHKKTISENLPKLIQWCSTASPECLCMNFGLKETQKSNFAFPPPFYFLLLLLPVFFFQWALLLALFG